MKKPTKKELINALELTLNEYENDIHIVDYELCHLCILADCNCADCIMGTWGWKGCTIRKNKAYHSQINPETELKKRKIIIFFKELINYFENENNFEIFFLENNSDFRKSEMKNIDEQAFDTL